MRWAAIPLVAVLLAVASPGLTLGQELSGNVILATSYPSVIADKGKQVTFPIEIVNRTQSWQEVELQLAEGPKEWEPVLKDRGFIIRKVQVGPGKSQTIDFQAKPPADAPARDYVFLIRAVTNGGAPVSELRLAVSLQDKIGAALKFTTQYPTLRGQAGNTFSFKMDLANDANEDRTITLSAVAPQGWEVVFKPAYESKQVTDVRVKAGSSQGVDVDVTPPQRAEAGDYKVTVAASAGPDRVEVPLNVTIVGNYKLSLTTPSGQLNARATIDQDSTVTLQVKNNGSATLENITFSSSKPEGWQVTFDPERIDSLAPGQSKDITAIIRPSSRALAGDYMVSVTASTRQTSESKDLRVTVETPTTWGWVGIGAIVVVFGGLAALYARLSRR